MAYNPYYQTTYPNYLYPQSFQQGQQQPQQNGFISVRSIEEAFNWPIAPGNSLTFKDESAPYIYTKTKGFSQLEQPIFEKFRLVKEENAPTIKNNTSESTESTQSGFDAEEQIKQLWSEIEALKDQIESMKPKPKKPVKKEVDENVSTE